MSFEPRSWRGVLDTTLCNKICQWLATGRWFSQRTLVSTVNKTDRHDITEILLKVALNTINHVVFYVEGAWNFLNRTNSFTSGWSFWRDCTRRWRNFIHGGGFFGTHFQYGYIVSKLSKVIIVFSTNNTDSHDINKISLTVALNSH